MAACVLVAKNLTLPMSVIARLVSKAPTVRRGWTGVACSHVRMVRWGSQSGQRCGEGGGYRVGGGCRSGVSAWLRWGWESCLYVALSPRDLTLLPLPSPFYSGQNGQLIYLLRIYCLSGLDLGIEDVAEGRPNPCGFGADRIDGVLSL